MSVLIKGMDMPKCCTDCSLMADGWCYAVEVWDTQWDGISSEKRPEWCPLVEVKTPHGRLIDADELHEKMYHEAFEVDSEMQKWDGGCWIRYKVFENCESDCPTVIESEE